MGKHQTAAAKKKENRQRKLRAKRFRPKVGNTEAVQQAWREGKGVDSLFNKLGIVKNANRIRTRVRQESATESVKPRITGGSLVAPPIDWTSLPGGVDQPKEPASEPEADAAEEVDPVERLKEVLGVPEEAEKRPPSISEDMRVTLRQLVAKYGADYSAMARDRKLNPFQLTKGALRKGLVIFFTQHATPEELDRAGLVLIDGEIVAKSLLRDA